MLTADAIQLIQKANAESVRPVQVKVEGEAPHVFRIFNPHDGMIGTYSTTPAPRDYAAFTIDGLAAQVLSLTDPGSSGAAKVNDVVVMVGPSEIRAIVGEQTRREFIRMGLQKSQALQALTGDDLEQITQTELLWMLRSTFAGKVTPDTFVPALKQIKFKKSTDGNSDVQQGRESMGRSVLMELAGAGDLSEEITLSLPVYANVPEATANIRCAVRIHLEESVFTIKPIDGEIDAAMASASRWIGEQLTAKVAGRAAVWVGAAMNGK